MSENQPKIVFFADGTIDAPPGFLKEHDVQVIPLRYQIGGIEGKFATADTQEQFDDFYGKMRDGLTSSTSLVLYDDAKEAFEPFFAKGCDVIHFGLSSGLAKTWENAKRAGEDLAQKYGRGFYAPDTKSVSAINYLYLREAINLSKEYQDFEELKAKFDLLLNKIKVFFTIEDLKYLYRSGRLSGIAKFIGNILNIKPIITTDADGKLVTHTKRTGRLASIQYLANSVEISEEKLEVAVLHADCPTDAELLERKIIEKHPDAKVTTMNVGFIIGTHTGPGTLGVMFWS